VDAGDRQHPASLPPAAWGCADNCYRDLFPLPYLAGLLYISSMIKTPQNSNLKSISSEIKAVFAEFEIKVIRLILFGSRSKGTAVKESDWDFLAVIDKKLDFHAQNLIRTQIRRRLAKKLVSVDIIIRSEDAYAQDREDIGSIAYYAVREGTSLWIQGWSPNG
jgi:predicted nucleotidyltransferase